MKKMNREDTMNGIMVMNFFSSVKRYISGHMKGFIYCCVFFIHLAFFVGYNLKFNQKTAVKQDVFEVFELQQKVPQEVNTIRTVKQKQSEYTEAEKIIINKEDKKKEEKKVISDPFELDGGNDGAYLPQFKLSDLPLLPEDEIRARIQYPVLAKKQGIEGSVILELYIDPSGKIRKINVLKDPGFGFSEAAVRALQGIKCQAGRSEGLPVASKFRYSVRFVLK